MDQQWSAYRDSGMGRPAQYDNNSNSNPYPHQLNTKYTSRPQHQSAQLPAGYTYESYQSPVAASKPSFPPQTTTANSTSMATPPTMTSQLRDYAPDADTTMEDADPYNRSKYPRASHNSRPVSQYLPNESSSAARRYSPMDILSPPYNSSPTKTQNSYALPPTTTTGGSRQSPTRTSVYSSPFQTYQSPPGSRASRPPVSSDFGADQFNPSSGSGSQNNTQFGTANSPRHSQQNNRSGRGPIPRFTKIRSTQELQPKINAQPPYRRANPEGGFISPLQALTSHLPATYHICNPSFKYESSRNPRRVLTKPSKGAKNDGYDNEESDYILYVNDILGSEENGHRYLILDVLGQGTFGQVVKCQNLKTQEVVAVKVVKNKTAYFNQSMMEVSVLDLLNSKYDKNDEHHVLRLKDTFIHRQHLCLVFELLSVNLYELIKQNQFRGLSTTLVRVFAQQLLNGLSLLQKARLIHCDLKPENILLKNLESPIIKIIDFGSACDERQTVYTYIQSRFYRSPEVLLGLPYSSAIDMWSLGCIVVELFLGLPLFPGSSEYNQIARITEMLGMPPAWMLEMGKQAGEFFEKVTDEYGRKTWRLKSMEQYSREHNTKEQPSKKYFQANTLDEIIKGYAMPRKNMKPAEIERELNNRVAFIDFVRGLLQINPLERWSPQQAKLHPFITQQKFTGPFVPPSNLKYANLNKTPAPGLQQQQAAEASYKQRQQQAAQAAQAAQQAQAQSAAQSGYSMQVAPYHPTTHPPPVYNGMYQQGAPPPYTSQPPGYGHQMGMMQNQLSQHQYGPSQSLYAQATTRAGRQRASTMDQHQSGIPPSIQRVASHLDPNAPIRLQPSPAYYPPPPDAYDNSNSNSRRRGSRAGPGHRNRDFIRTLEDGVLGEGFNQSQWH